eukprot:5647958-Amphidinium_carterae.2
MGVLGCLVLVLCTTFRVSRSSNPPSQSFKHTCCSHLPDVLTSNPHPKKDDKKSTMSILGYQGWAGSGLCFNCGSKEHTSAEGKRARKGPVKGNSSHKGSGLIQVIGVGHHLQVLAGQRRVALRVEQGQMIRMVGRDILEVSHLANEREQEGTSLQLFQGPVSRAKLRQGAMPHISRKIATVLRCTLKDTRDQPRVIEATEIENGTLKWVRFTTLGKILAIGPDRIFISFGSEGV